MGALKLSPDGFPWQMGVPIRCAPSVYASTAGRLGQYIVQLQRCDFGEHRTEESHGNQLGTTGRANMEPGRRDEV
ncbi:uncharacterized protein GLRG_10166 [Colletotrichum graminicola M1.001]|uniref:Uncharacterized protein n=1 Tax=Colletotrichum graminicola (strain M1.001 / M2 / FGSC 10212) TaxID=645133 RepID=E3QVY4_COLGM|nr:uncharacterized protein GLRG_10166 [Colletotrichum graminicola M1.001]EFQ35022.1 hypothetical protein GLRG_10166 [Colletotrichum graminicola M1.001]